MEVTVEEFQKGEVVPVRHDLVSELKIKTDSIEELVEELKTQDQKTLFWGGLAVREAERFNKWESIELKKWKAHCNYYAKLIMKSRKDSITMQGLGEVVAEIYSKKVVINEELKLMYVEQVMKVMLSTKELEELKLNNKYTSKIQQVKEEMYSYNESFEEIMDIYYGMQADKELVALVADAFKARSYSLSGIKQLTVGLEGEGFQVPRRTVEALESVATKLENLAKDRR